MVVDSFNAEYKIKKCAERPITIKIAIVIQRNCFLFMNILITKKDNRILLMGFEIKDHFINKFIFN